jgi:hypothetical protein
LVLGDAAALQSHFDADLLRGVQVITGKAEATRFSPARKNLEMEERSFQAMPYYAWAHRGPSEMAVWLATEVDKAKPLFGPSMASTAQVPSSGGERIAALNDDQIPSSQPIRSDSAFVWTTRRDTVWVQYNFAQTEEISEGQVYWYDNGETCRVPKSWRILARFNGEWHRVGGKSALWRREEQIQ